MKNLLFVVGIHGDEKTPVEVIASFKPRINYLVANKPALRKDRRFLEKDLNRVFPGAKCGFLEEILARKILTQIKNKKPDAVIDLHSSTCYTPPFAIITQKSPKHIVLAKNTGISKIVFMSQKIASGRSLIDHVNLGISIEAGKEGNKRGVWRY